MHLSHADHGSTPPRVEIPRDYNAAHDLLQRNAARPRKVAFIDASACPSRSESPTTTTDVSGAAS